MRIHVLVLAALAAAVSTPVHADLVARCAAMTTSEPCVTYTGTVFRHGRSPQALDLVAGTTVTFTLEYAPSRLTDFGAKRLQDGDDNPILVHPFGATVANGALADYEITAGSHQWTLSEDENFGFVNELDIGPYPFVAFDGTPTKFLGVEADALNDESLEFISAPGDLLLDANSNESTILDANGHLVALVDTSLDRNIQAARAEDLAAAQVPEPSSLALLLLGGIGLCASLEAHESHPDGRRLRCRLTKQGAISNRAGEVMAILDGANFPGELVVSQPGRWCRNGVVRCVRGSAAAMDVAFRGSMSSTTSGRSTTREMARGDSIVRELGSKASA